MSDHYEKQNDAARKNLGRDREGNLKEVVREHVVSPDADRQAATEREARERARR